MRKIALVLFFAFPNITMAQSLRTPQVWSRLKSIVNTNHKKSFYLKDYDGSVEKELLSKYTFGVLAYERGEFESAKKHFKQSLKAEDLKAYIYFYLGQIAKKQGQVNEALANFKRSLNLDPQHDLKRKTNYEIAQVYIQQSSYTQARRYLNYARKAYKHTENHADILWKLLYVDIQRKSSSKCYWFEEIFETYPTYNRQVQAWTLNPKTWQVSFKQKSNQVHKLNCDRKIGDYDRRSHIRQLIVLGEYKKAKKELADPKLKIDEFDLLRMKTNFALRAGDPKKAFENLDSYYDKYKKNRDYLRLYTKTASRSMNHDSALKAYDQRIALRRSRGGKAYVVFRKAFLLYEMGDYKQAYNTFEKVLKIYPRSVYQGDTYWYLAWTSYLQKDYDKAIDHFQYLLSRIENHKWFRSKDHYSAARIKYWLAQSFRSKGQNMVANAHFQEIIDSDNLNYYAFLAASYLNPKNQKAQLKQKKSKKKNQFKSPLFESLKLPWVTKYQKSSVFADTNVDFPHALASLDSKDLEVSNLDHKLKKSKSHLSEGRSFASANSKKNIVQVFKDKKFQAHLQRYQILSRLGFTTDAKWELYELEKRSKTKEEKKALSHLYLEVGDIYRATKILTLNFDEERNTPRDFSSNPLFLWSSTYPQPHKNVVQTSSDLFQVPENLIYSIMRAESFYRKRAMSGAGARGLLQLMPFTASRVAGILGYEKDFQPAQLFEPSTNIQLGVRYLKRLLKAFEGDQLLAIAAYNAGPHRAEWWVNQFGQLRQDEFVEHILFLETRNYVKKVMRFQWIYDLLYDQAIDLAEMKKPIDFELTRRPSLTEQW